MAQKIDKPLVDHGVLALAGRQHGIVTRAQLTAFGLDDRAIGRRVRAGRLHRVYRGVYAVGHERLTTHGRFLAAVFACGEHAALSHYSAAVLWALRPERGPRIDVTVPTTGGRKRRGALIVHRAPLPADEVTVRQGVPVTTPARTIVDLADGLSRRLIERVLDEAAYLRLDLDGRAPRPGRRGAGLLARVLADHEAGSTRTRSDLEELMLSLCRRAGLPQPEVNQVIEGHEVDFVWRETRLIVETDGWGAHRTRAAFETDRLRDAELTAAGWRVVRITKRRLEREPDAVARQIARLLAGYSDGSSSSLPLVRRPSRSSWARRTSDSG
jgi:very-short-patch-repair endonuclease